MKILDNIQKQIEALGIVAGDLVYLSTDISKLLFETRKIMSPETLITEYIDRIISIIGHEGTLLIPSFNWDFCKGITFNRHEVSSRTGHIPNIMSKHEGFIRTKNPIYSFIVWGKKAQIIADLPSRSCFGLDSVFHYLYVNHGKQILLDVEMKRCFTYTLYAEKMANCQHRYDKAFTANYIDYDHSESVETYSMFVRDLSKTYINHLNKLGLLLESKGISKRISFDHHCLSVVDLHGAFDVCVDDIKNNHGRSTFEYI